MEFLKTLAREAECMSPVHSDSSPLSVSPPACALASPLDALHIAIVMEMLTDELEALSKTVSAQQPELRSKFSVALTNKENRPKFSVRPDHQPGEFSLVQHYTTVIPRRMLQGLGDMPFWSASNLHDLMAEAKIKTDTPKGKYQMDRTFLQLVADNNLRELLQTGTFTHLYQTIEAEKAVLRNFWVTCLKLTYDKAKIHRLKKEIEHVREEKWLKKRELDQEIFNLKDQALEQDKRSELEFKLTENQGQVIVKRFKRKHRQVLAYHHGQIALMRRKISWETIVHNKMVGYLKKMLDKLEKLLQYWIEKYEVDFTQLCQSLEDLIERRQKDMQRFNYLTDLVDRREPVVMEDRRLKGIVAMRVKHRALEEKCAIKLQAWWRGTMVRNELGPYKGGIVPKSDGADTGKKGKKGKK